MQPQSVMLIFSYYRIPQQLTLNWRLTDWRLSTPVCYPDFSHTSLYNNTLHKYSDYRLVRVKIWWPRNNPATQLFPGAFKEMSRRREVLVCIVLPFCLLCSFFHITVFHSNLRWTGDLQTEGCRRLSVILIFHIPLCITILYTNIPITDSSGRKYADRGITLPQVLTGAFKWARVTVHRSVCCRHNHVITCYPDKYKKRLFTDCRRCGKESL